MKHIEIFVLSLAEYRDLKKNDFTIQLPNGQEIIMQVEGKRAKVDPALPKDFPCKKCDKAFTTHHGLAVHVNRKHGK